MFVPHHKNPPPPSRGKIYILYPLSRVLVTIGVYKNSPFSDFSPEIFPRQTPQNAPFPVKMETHGSLYIRIGGPGANFFFPPQLWTPSTNSFAYSQSELHDMNMNDLRLRNKIAHARGLVILLPRWLEDTRKMHIYLNFLYQFTCKTMATSESYCTVLSFRIRSPSH